jgi:polyprenyl-phospho-N-acetylgalactosaminyl synthase
VNIFLIIPSFNEGKRLAETLQKATQYIPAEKIIVVDDGSRTPETLPKNAGSWLLRHRLNLGKGAAMRTGADFAFEHGADAIIYMDADCQHDPAELPIFIEHLDNGYDVVFGSRKPTLHAPLIRIFGRKLTSLYTNLLFGIYVADTLSGYRALTRSAYKKCIWNSDRYAVESEMIARIGKHKNSLRIVEIPIETIYMDKYKGMTVIDAIRLMFSSIIWKFN